MHSEEILTLDVALQFCDELKTQLGDAIDHIEELTRRYNHTDYMENIRMLEKSRAELSPYIAHLHSQLTLSPSSLSPFVPVPSTSASAMHRHHQRLQKSPTETSTPKVLTRVRRALDLSPIQTSNESITEITGTSVGVHVKDDNRNSDSNLLTKRSVQDINQNNNTITVRALKVQRSIEAVLNHLKVLEKIHERNHTIALEQSLYQSCNNSMCGASTPGKLGHTHCCDDGRNWSLNCPSAATFNTSVMTSAKKKHSHPYKTPLRKIRSHGKVPQAILLKSC